MFKIARLTADDLHDLEALFRDFPHKAYQQRFQGIDPQRLAAWFAAGERAKLARAGEQPPPAWIVRQGRALTAFAAVHPDPWHAQFYALNSKLPRMARIAPFLAWNAAPQAKADLLDTLLTHADTVPYDHLSIRVDGSEFDAVQLLSTRGFYLVDGSVKMSGRTADVPDCPRPRAIGRVTIRRAIAADRDPIRQIAATSHPLNHYYNDPHLHRQDTQNLFAAWVAKCLDGLASDIFVAHAAGRVLGFAIFLTPATINNTLDTRLVVLDFVCLDRSVQGGGLGRYLLAHALHRLAKRFDLVELRTTLNNYPAMNCYRDLGMRIVSTDFGLHRRRATPAA